MWKEARKGKDNSVAKTKEWRKERRWKERGLEKKQDRGEKEKERKI